MGKYFCSECNQTVDDVVCPVCGAPTESLVFNESDPQGRSGNDRYDDSAMAIAHIPDAEVDAEGDEISLEDEETEDETE